MRMMKRLFTAVLVLAILAVGVVLLVVFLPTKSTLSGAASAHAGPSDLAEYSTRLSDCVACHSVADGKPFAGGLAMGTPLGTIYSTNITPDSKTGIGSYSLADFDNAVRHGIAKDGHRLYPAMPYPSYAKLSDDDVRLLFQYFTGSVAAVEQANKPSDISWPLNMRWPLAMWNRVFTDKRPYAPKPDHDASWNRGAYLVQGPGHCGSCHTPRGVAFNEEALNEDSSKFLSGAVLDGWKASSLRGEMDVGLGRWSEDDIVKFLKNGHNDRASVYGSMMDAFNNSTQYLSADDVGAIAHYLKSLPPSTDNPGKVYAYDEITADNLRSGEAKTLGAKQYLKNCVWCHGRDGKGQGSQLSALAGNPSVIDADALSVINIILNGAGRVVKNEEPDTYRMYPFRALMSDAEVAAVTSFIRSGWGNKAPAVQEKDVAELRAQTNPTSGRVIILKMR
jgi:alcohol dehydrogenase (quinone), cytochrome c subunit